MASGMPGGAFAHPYVADGKNCYTQQDVLPKRDVVPKADDEVLVIVEVIADGIHELCLHGIHRF